MDLINFFKSINLLLDIPVTIAFLCVALFLTLYLGIPQIRFFKHFLSFAKEGFGRSDDSQVKTINAFHAMFTAMSTSIGVGTVVGPSLAIALGGPGALFWLVIYAILGSVTKLTEVSFAIKFREITQEGRVIGGPAEYLRKVHPFLASWYGVATIFLFAGWSGIQSKALSEILLEKGVPEWISGLCLAVIVFIVLIGGAKRVGNVASRLVPLMFILYVTFSCWILLTHLSVLGESLQLIFRSVLYPTAPVGGFLGATLFAAIREGTFKGVFITESGMGTSSIAHSMSDVKRPLDQGILAMYSVAAEIFLCILSGLLVLVTGVWKTGVFSNILVFKIFESQLPIIGPTFFIASIILFITTTAIGNSFNGSQSFAAFTKYRWIKAYYLFVCTIIFLSSIAHLSLVWAVMDVVLPLVAIPNLIGILYLTFKYPKVLTLK